MAALQRLLSKITDEPLLQAGIVILASLVLAYLLNRLITKLLLPFLGRVSKTQIDDDLVKLLHGPILKTIVLIGLGIATGLLDFDIRIETVTIGLLWTIAIVIWTGFAFRFTRRMLVIAKGRKDKFLAIEARTFPLFDNVGKILILALASYLLIVAWGADVTGWVASAGIVGLALSFAAQDSLANLFAGVFIIADAPYTVGDYINLESGERGKVSHIGLRSTRILTRDDIEITIPNSVMGKARIVNESAGPHPKHRVRVKVGVAYGSDVDQVRDVLIGVTHGETEVCADPEPRVRFRTFGDSSLDFELLCWIPDPELRGRVIDTLNTKIYKRFAEVGIEIPFPKRDVYIREMPNLAKQT